MADNFDELEELKKSLDVVREDLERLNNLEKSRIGKYISKKFVNGKWIYKYYPDRNKARLNIKPCVTPLLNCNIKNALQEGENFIKDWQKDWELNPNKSRCGVLNGKTVVIAAVDDNGNEGMSLKHFGYKGSQKNKMRPATQILERARLLPIAKEMLESKDKCVLNEVRSSKDFIDYELLGKTVVNGAAKKVCVIVSKKRNDKLTYLSIMEKALSEDKAFLKDVHFWAEQAANPEYRSATTNRLPQNNRLVNKSLSIIIDGVTVGNRAEKYEQLERALTGRRYAEVPADGTEKLPLLNIRIKDYSLGKVNKALRAASLSLGVPTKSAKGEAFTFKAQEDLTDKWAEFFSDIVRKTYDFVIEYFDLPKITVMSKAVNLTWKGKVLYSPESGEPITQKEWDFFVKNLEKFLNRNVSNAAERIVLDSKALGHILDRMLKTNTLENIKKQNLESLKYNGKTFDWISDSVKNMKNALGESLTRQETARIAVIQQSAAEKITKITDGMKSDVKQILIDGVVDHKSKSQVSQALFDKMVGHNRDFQRIADTEIQRTFNNSFIREEVYNAAEGEKVYFERVEVVDGNTCPYCRKINGKIAVWSDTPLASGAVKDEYADLAIWEGKEWDGKKLERIADAPISVVHPYCRGTWIRCYPELDGKKKKAVQKSLETETLEKAHKYIRRWLDASGQWKYEYPNQFKGEHSAKHRARVKAEIARNTELIERVNPINPDDVAEVNEKLNELEALSKNKKLKYRNMNVVFYKKKFKKHLERPNGKGRDEKELKTRKALLPYIPRILENGRIDEISHKGKETFIGVAGRALVNGIETGIEITLVKKTADKKMVLSLFDIDIKKSLLSANVFTNKQKRLADSQALMTSDNSDFNLNILYIGDSVNVQGE
mgnify:CR=1 FL=1